MARVSVLVQSHERPEGLRRALLSLQMQSYRDFEVVVSDDSARGEEIRAVLDGPAAAGLDLRVAFTPPCGAAESMREAFGRSRGELVKILHDDDWLTPHSLACQVAALDHHADVNAVYGQALIAYPHGDRLYANFGDQALKVDSAEWVAQYARDGMGPIQSPVTALYRRHAGFRVMWDEFRDPRLREAARKTGAGTDVSLQVDNAASNRFVVLLPYVACVLGTDMGSTTQVDPGIPDYYRRWKAEYDTHPPWRRT